MDSISWRSKLAQRRSLFLLSHDPHTNVYLNILQWQQSRASTFQKQALWFHFCGHCVAVVVRLSESGRASPCSGDCSPQSSLASLSHSLLLPVPPACRQESLGLLRTIEKALGKPEAAAKNDRDLFPKPFTTQLLFQSSSPVISLWGLTRGKHRQVFIKWARSNDRTEQAKIKPLLRTTGRKLDVKIKAPGPKCKYITSWRTYFSPPKEKAEYCTN